MFLLRTSKFSLCCLAVVGINTNLQLCTIVHDFPTVAKLVAFQVYPHGTLVRGHKFRGACIEFFCASQSMKKKSETHIPRVVQISKKSPKVQLLLLPSSTVANTVTTTVITTVTTGTKVKLIILVEVLASSTSSSTTTSMMEIMSIFQ